MAKTNTCPKCGRGASFIVGLGLRATAHCENGHTWKANQ